MTGKQKIILRHIIFRLTLVSITITCFLPLAGQDSLGLTKPTQRIDREAFYRQPRTIKLGELPNKSIPAEQLETLKPTEVQLKNLEKKRFESPEFKNINFQHATLTWNKSTPVDFTKFSDRSKFNLSKIDSDQGLASDKIQDMVQDQQGNWWFATVSNGVILFDGTSQHVFNKDNGLSSNLIQALLIDHLGQVWIGGDQGIDIFDGQALKQLNTSNGLPDNSICALYEDDLNRIWIGTEKGLARFDKDQNKIQVFTEKQGLTNSVIWSIHKDNQGQTWIGTEAGLSIMEEPSTDEYVLTNVLQSNGLPTDNIWSIAEDAQGNIWMGSNGHGIYQWGRQNNQIKMYNSDHGLSSDWIWSIFPTPDNGIWFGTYSNGAIHYQEIDGQAQFRQLQTDEGLTNNYVLKITADNQGRVLMGTDGGGVNVLHKPQGVTKHYNESTGLNEKFVQCIFRDSEGLLWMGTDSRGVNMIDEKIQKVSYLTEKEGLSYNSVWAILEDKEGKIWMGTESGLNIYDKTNKSLTTYDTLSGLSGNSPWTLFRDNKDNVWIGTEDGGFCKFDARTEKIIQYEDYGLGDIATMGFTQDRRGNIWVATRGSGLVRIDEEERIEIYDRTNGLSSDSITYLFRDSKDRIWAATEEHGLNYFKPGTSPIAFERFNMTDGLSSNGVWSVIEDDQERIWVGTVDKITIIAFEEGQPQTIGYISTEDGLKSNDLNPSSVFKEKNGDMIWATIKGPSVVDPKLFQPQSKSYVVQVTNVEIEDQFIDFRNDRTFKFGNQTLDLATTPDEILPFSNVPEQLSLPPEVADLRIHFSMKEAYLRKDLQFQYKLSPTDREWRNTQTRSSVILNNLGHGAYTLEIKARAPGGEWGIPTNFPFVIKTPWWETTASRIMALLIVVLALYAFYVIRTRSLIKSKQYLEDKVKQRTYELERSLREVVEARNQLVHSERMASLGMLSSGIAHELSNPISAVYNATELMERDFEELLEQNGSMEDAKENMKLSLDILKVASNQTREIIRGLTNYSRLESKEMILGDVHQCLDNSVMLIQSKLVDVQIEKSYQPNIPLIKCYYTELTQVFLNLLSNAVDAIQEKSEAGSLIKISTEIEKRFVKISVTDDGVGMSIETSQSVFKNFYTSKEPGRGTGLGLAISQSIIKKHNGSISFETEKNVGTTFTTLLPIE